MKPNLGLYLHKNLFGGKCWDNPCPLKGISHYVGRWELSSETKKLDINPTIVNNFNENRLHFHSAVFEISVPHLVIFNV